MDRDAIGSVVNGTRSRGPRGGGDRQEDHQNGHRSGDEKGPEVLFDSRWTTGGRCVNDPLRGEPDPLGGRASSGRPLAASRGLQSLQEILKPDRKARPFPKSEVVSRVR
jgi:hypothetical protein